MRTFSMSSMQAWRSRPKSMKTQSMPSRLYSCRYSGLLPELQYAKQSCYSTVVQGVREMIGYRTSCSSTNMWWLKNCCRRSFTKLIHSCSNELNWKGGYCSSKERIRHGHMQVTCKINMCEFSGNDTHVEDLETGDVEHTDEVVAGDALLVERLVAPEMIRCVY